MSAALLKLYSAPHFWGFRNLTFELIVYSTKDKAERIFAFPWDEKLFLKLNQETNNRFIALKLIWILQKHITMEILHSSPELLNKMLMRQIKVIATLGSCCLYTNINSICTTTTLLPRKKFTNPMANSDFV